MAEVYRVGVGTNAKVNTQLVVKANGTTTRVSTQQYSKTLQRHHAPSSTPPQVSSGASVPPSARKGVPSGSAINANVEGRLYGNRSGGVGFGNPASKTYQPGATPAESYTAKNYREYQWRENPRANGINQPRNTLPQPRQPNTTPPTTAPTQRMPNGGIRPGTGLINPLAVIPGAIGAAKTVATIPLIPIGLVNKDVANLVNDLSKSANEDFRKMNEAILGPFSDLDPFKKTGVFKDAPWNKRDNPNSLNPGPQQEKFNPEPQPGDYPFENAPQSAVVMKIDVPEFQRIYKAPDGKIYPWDTSGGYSFTVIARPIGIRVSTSGAQIGAQITVALVYEIAPGWGESERIILQYSLASSVPSGSGFVLAQPPYTISNGPPLPEALKTTEPIKMPSPIEWPQSEEFPIPPQYEPQGRPEYPYFPIPDSPPLPLAQTARPPALAPQPTPIPQPNIPQPNPTPKPAPDPLAPAPQPAPDSLPDTIPRPQPQTNPWPFPVAPVAPMPMPPTPANPAAGPQWIPTSKTTTTTYDPLAPSNSQSRNPSFQQTPFKAPSFFTTPTGAPAPVGTPQTTPEALSQQISKLGQEVEEKTRQGCRYEEDDFAPCSFQVPVGETPTGDAIKVPKTIQMHEKLIDFAQELFDQMGKISQVLGIPAMTGAAGHVLVPNAQFMATGVLTNNGNLPMVAKSLPQLMQQLTAIPYVRQGLHRLGGEFDRSLMAPQLGKVTITDALGFQNWQFNQLEERLGLPTPQVITNASGQVQTKQFINIQDAIEETNGIATANAQDLEVIERFIFALSQDMQKLMQIALQTRGDVDAIIDDLGFKYKEVKKSHPTHLNLNPDVPGASLNRLFNNGSVHYVAKEWEGGADKNQQLERIGYSTQVAAMSNKYELDKTNPELPLDKSKSVPRPKNDDEIWKTYVSTMEEPPEGYISNGNPVPEIKEIKNGAPTNVPRPTQPDKKLGK